MATSNQKFLLLLEKDKFFKTECLFLIKKWNLDDIKTNDTFFTYRHSSDLPFEYVRDLEFVLCQSKLQRRYLWALHKYLISGIIPKESELPKKAIIYYSAEDPLVNILSMSIKIDADASKADINLVTKEFTKMKSLIQENWKLEKKQQPILNIQEARKIIGSVPDLRGQMADDMSTRPIKDYAKDKNRLDVKNHRYGKTFSGENKISVAMRSEYEESINNIETEW